MTITAGIDVGTGAVKTAIFKVEAGKPTWLAKRADRLRQRDPFQLAAEFYDLALKDAGLTRKDVAYCATTGDGESIEFHTGHFYSMTTHGRGGLYLDPRTRAVLDVGALHGRAIRVDERGKVLSYKMTSQCASGSGQFLENIARYLGIAQDEIGALSQQGDNPEKSQRHLRSARRNRRHQHGLARNIVGQHPQGHSRFDGRPAGETS